MQAALSSRTDRLVLGALSLAAAVAAAVIAGPVVLAAWLLPDLVLIGGFAEPGRLRPSRVAAYNAVHALPGPLALMLIGLTTSPVVVALGLIWLSHVTLDRAVGYGQRSADGRQRG